MHETSPFVLCTNGSSSPIWRWQVHAHARHNSLVLRINIETRLVVQQDGLEPEDDPNECRVVPWRTRARRKRFSPSVRFDFTGTRTVALLFLIATYQSSPAVVNSPRASRVQPIPRNEQLPTKSETLCIILWCVTKDTSQL